MIHPTHEHSFMKQLKSITHNHRPPRQVIQSLRAKMMLEYAIYSFNKHRLETMINEALDNKNKEQFTVWSKKYKEFINRYKDGKVIREHGYELKLDFDHM